jgi:hypothetical protein
MLASIEVGSEPFEGRIADRELGEVRLGGFHVIRVLARNTLALPNETDQVAPVEPARILVVAPIRDVAHGVDDAPVGEPRPERNLAIDEGYLLAGTEIGEGGFGQRSLHTKGDAFAGSAAVEPEHHARSLLGATMNMGIDAKRTMISADASGMGLGEREARTPHQRPVGEHPEIIVACHGV